MSLRMSMLDRSEHAHKNGWACLSCSERYLYLVRTTIR
ncbi:hypothetical protein HMPREF1568_1840 [Providencia alcalifaciens PAL-3]|nr:hypothetical protein HMPREF1568_1840 [Providencia alcalifaciens PAL-3]EUC98930.1 hypothetical protein HMPREF1566_1412 [Providencia alcalifaciens PAL-1]